MRVPALAALFCGATFIALSPIWVRVADVGPTASAFWRVALAVPLLWSLVAVQPRGAAASRREGGLLFAAGLAFAGDLAFWHWSIQATSVANATLLANLSSIFVTLAAWVLWRQRPSAQFLVGLALALGGVLLLVRASLGFASGALLGDAYGVVTAMFYAWYLLTVKSLRDRGASTLRLMATTTTLTAMVLLPLALASGEPMLPASARGWLILLGLAWITHAGGQGLITFALAHLPAAFSSVGLLLQPVLAAAFAWALLQEPVGILQIAGGAVVLAGIYLARRGST
ncbi:MAG TPA: DMT family transporter [Burkholderiales bacterium]|nr:DMT family transporter [Burkholderiales bacterium]